MIGVAIASLVVGLMPSYQSFATSNTQHVTTPLPQITGQDTDKETNDDHSATTTQTPDDHNTKADPETNDGG